MMRRISLVRATFWLFSVLLATCTAETDADTTMTVNPVQVRIDPFRIELGPTNNNAQSTLSLVDAETILGIVEDLVSTYARHYFGEVDDTEFKYVILAYVEFPSDLHTASATTVLEFSGGISYFGGMSSVVPSTAEMHLLVDLALNDNDLQRAIAWYFPFITRAEYHRGSSSGSSNIDVTGSSGSNDPPADGNAASALLNEDILDLDTGDDSTNQFIIIVASACAAGLAFCLLLGVLAYLHQQRRKSYWREDAARNSNSITNKIKDAALEDLEDDNNSNNSKRRNKQQSLHLRDSLQEMHNHEQHPQDGQSDAGSSRLGRLLSTAAAAALPAPPSDDDGLEKPGVVNRKRSTSTSSCSRSDEEEAIPHPANNNNNQDTGDVADDLTCPSDFEGNAVIRPNLVPVPTYNLDRFQDEGGMLEPLPPPSRTASARRDELPVSLNNTATPTSSRTDAFLTPTKHHPSSKTSSQEGFLAKYIHPIAGSVSLPYFGSSGADDTADNNKDKDNKQGEISPRTEATTPEDDLDIDARWSDISSELDLGNKTDDDFEMDQAWDPDDASVNSSECGKDVFSPMAKTSDEVRLLKSTENLKYNLVKIKTLPHSPGSRGTSPQRTVQARDTTIV